MPTKTLRVASRDESGEVVKDEHGNPVMIDSGRVYEVTGKKFIWHPLPDEDGGDLPDVVLPLRIKMRLVRQLAGRDMDNETMFEMLAGVAPDCAETFEEMDVNDFQTCFVTWQTEYNAMTGATPGE